ncbi:tetraacyldisaccharide 4'-kinase [Flavobacterium beibuense F44-8]|uniref:Tetraacyldisaccharide 4'-kinase n=1 Tax=Flavobacterium beibuense F44-8 TaxID=1406840 RepID=A0A0A2M7T1_9FLAO|nr:tetraacyldisaccharide 4'-kinase [Flavobacterium beibuense]KGO84360.1 tetraacyldisaccharide 4'-kinase [Flavobacterium beibuense F44-8]
MKLIRKILLPFSLLYWLVMAVRNFLYDTGFLKSQQFSVPVIAIGNLSTGGTGKSPQTEYLIRLLKDNYRLATLSRGYKRKSEGYVLADINANADILGDEPYQFYSKFPDINVAVDANRVNGIDNLLQLNPSPEVIVLDDAYQHRKVKAGFYILLTAYGDIYADDYLLPAGNLREGRSGAKRADVIVVTKCPADITEAEQEKIKKKLRPQPEQKVYFTTIEYDIVVYGDDSEISTKEVKEKDKVLVAGIAKPKPFFDQLKNSSDVCLTYPDHHDFSAKDIDDILAAAKDRIVVTTEKDYVRLKDKMPAGKLFYLPIKTSFITNGDDFNKTVLNYVGKSSANG